MVDVQSAIATLAPKLLVSIQNKCHHGPDHGTVKSKHSREDTMETSSRSDKPVVMNASEFRARCLKLMDDLNERGGEFTIAKNGRPVSRLVPYQDKSNLPFSRHKERIKIHGDIVSPMPPGWFLDPDHSDADLY